MQKSSINPHIFGDLFNSASNAADKGQAQWFTPPEWAKVLALPLPEFRPAIVDLTCGTGNLLHATRNTQHAALLGCDIEPLDPRPSTLFQHADVTQFYEILQAVNWQADLFVLNPPWSLSWYRKNLQPLADSECTAVRAAFRTPHSALRNSEGTIDSTIATICIALDRMSRYGEAYCIANEATLQRLIFAPNAPHAALAEHIWAHLVIDGNICAPSSSSSFSFSTGVIYFARDHHAGITQHATRNTPQIIESRAQAEETCRRLHAARQLARHGAQCKNFAFTNNTVELWTAAAEEWRDRYVHSEKPKYNIWLEPPSSWNLELGTWNLAHGQIRTHLNVFATRSGKVSQDDAAALHLLNGKQPIQLVVQRAQRQALANAVAPDSAWLVDPKLPEALELAIKEYNAVRSPLYPLPEIQRLGYLDELDFIECKEDLATDFGNTQHATRNTSKYKPTPAFFAGHRYSIRTTTVSVKRTGTRLNLAGDEDEVEWDGQELAIFIRDAAGIERTFMEARLKSSTLDPRPSIKINLLKPHPRDETKKPVADEDRPVLIDYTLQDLVKHFIIPEVPDIATVFQTQYEQNLKTLAEIEALCT